MALAPLLFLVTLALPAAPPAALPSARAPPAAKARVPKIMLIGAFDGSGQIDTDVKRTLDASLARNKRYAIVPATPWVEAAEAMDLEVVASLQPPHLATIAAKLGVSAVLVSQIVGGDALATRIELHAVDPVTGRVLAADRQQVSIDFGAGSSSIRLTRQQSDRLVSSVLKRLPRLKPPPAPAALPPAPDTPESAAAAPDGTSSGTSPTTTPSAPAAPTAPTAPVASTSGTEAAAPTEPEAAPSLESLLAQTPDIKLGANVAFAEWIYFLAAAGKVPARHEVTGALQLTGTTALYTASVRLLARKDFGDAGRDRIEAEEAWVELGYGGLRLRAGRNIIVWDPFISTISTPGSPITPVDERDFVRGEVLPINNVRLAYDLGPVIFEGYYLPVPERSLGTFAALGTTSGRFVNPSRWYVDGSAEAGLFGDEAPAPVDIAGGLRAAPPTPQNGQGALRAFADLTWLRLSLSYGYLLSLNPAFAAGKLGDDGVVPVVVTYPRFHLVHFAGALTSSFVSTGLDLRLTSPTDFSRVDLNTIFTVGLTSPTLADAHRFGGGVVLFNSTNLAPTLANDAGNAALASLLDSAVAPYAYYSYGRLEVITIVVQASLRAPNLVNLTQLSLKVGPVTTLLAATSAWGANETLFGELARVNRLELVMKASL